MLPDITDHPPAFDIVQTLVEDVEIAAKECDDRQGSSQLVGDIYSHLILNIFLHAGSDDPLRTDKTDRQPSIAWFGCVAVRFLLHRFLLGQWPFLWLLELQLADPIFPNLPAFAQQASMPRKTW
jgi:hypothetical protein